MRDPLSNGRCRNYLILLNTQNRKGIEVLGDLLPKGVTVVVKGRALSQIEQLLLFRQMAWICKDQCLIFGAYVVAKCNTPSVFNLSDATCQVVACVSGYIAFWLHGGFAVF